MSRHHVIVAGSVLVDMLGYGLIMPLLPFIVKTWVSDATVIGLLGSLYAAMQLLAAPLLGTLSDRIGRRPVLLICLFGSAVAYLGLALAGSLPLVILAIALGGAAGSSMPVAQAYIADTTTAERRTQGFGLLGAAFGLGLIGGSAIGGLLSQYGLALPPAVAATIAFLNALWATIALPETLPPNQRRIQSVRLTNPFVAAASVLLLPQIRPLLGAVVLLNIAFAGLQNNVAYFTMIRFGWGPEQNAVLFVFVGLCAFITQVFLLRILQPLLGERHLAGGGLGLMALSFALVGLVHDESWRLFPIAAMLAAGMGLAVPALTSLISLRAGDRRQGATLGGMQTMISIALVIGPLSFGFIFDQFGTDAPYLTGSLMLLGAWLITVLTFMQPKPVTTGSLHPVEDSEA